MTKRLKRFIDDESGATAIEYALLAGIMTLAILISLGVIAGKLSNTFNEVGGNIN